MAIIEQITNQDSSIVGNNIWRCGRLVITDKGIYIYDKNSKISYLPWDLFSGLNAKGKPLPYKPNYSASELRYIERYRCQFVSSNPVFIACKHVKPGYFTDIKLSGDNARTFLRQFLPYRKFHDIKTIQTLTDYKGNVLNSARVLGSNGRVYQPTIAERMPSKAETTGDPKPSCILEAIRQYCDGNNLILFYVGLGDLPQAKRGNRTRGSKKK